MHLPDAMPAPTLPPAFARRPLLLAVLLSVGVHAGVLGLTAMTSVPHLPSVELVRVAVLPGGGSAGRPAAASAPPAGVPAPVVAVASPPAPPPHVAPQTRPAVLPAPKPAASRRRPAPRIAARPKAASTTDAPAAPPAPPDTGSVPIADTTSAAGAAVGTTTGGGTGSRSGAGGSGGGTGDGRGGGTDIGDQRAACVFCPEPAYPLIARRRGWQGTVDVGLVLLTDGRVESARVRQSSGFEVLDREALAVARRSRFRLPDLSGTAVVGQIKYRFELVGTD